MKKVKILGLLLLAAFIFTMGFNEPAFAASKFKELSKKLDEIKAQIQTHDGDIAADVAAEYNGLLTKLNEIQDLIQPVWSRVLPAAERFQLVMNDEAVLDRETGLVWERSPGTTEMVWAQTQFYCYDRIVGGRKGWRPPTIEELASLIDPTQSNPALPAGHPFLGVQSNWYWSATTNAQETNFAFIAAFSDGTVNTTLLKSNGHFAWCVRGGHGYDAY